MDYKAVNAEGMNDEQEIAEAEKGLQHRQDKNLYPGYQLFRFASAAYRVDWLTNGWWTGFSSEAALRARADVSPDQLSLIARAALAIYIKPGSTYNKMDILLRARVSQPLVGWTGMPRTISTRRSDRTYLDRWEPDRSIAQFYIPHLARWTGALVLEEAMDIPGNQWTPGKLLP